MKQKISEKVISIQPSATLVVPAKARALMEQGIDVINLAGGATDFDTPPHIVEKTGQALRAGHTHSTVSAGMREFREAIGDKLKRDNELEFNYETEIVITPGAKFAIFASILVTIDKGDEALIVDPFWVSFEACVRLAGGIPVRVPLSKEDNFRITEAKLRRKLTGSSKLVVMSSPNNPTGRVFSQEELEAIAKVAIENDLLVLSDEVYENFVFDGHQHISIGSLPGMLHRTITVNGFSKGYSMSGFRLGYVAAKEFLATEILKVQQHAVTCAVSFSQFGGLSALTGPRDAVVHMVEEFRKRRDILTDGLNDLAGVFCQRPEGTFLAFPDISGTGMSSMEFAEMLLDKARVAVVPGVAFGDSGEGHVRIAFDNSTESIEKALERMRQLL